LGSEQSFRDYTNLLRTYLPLSGSAPLQPSHQLVDLGLDSLNTVALLVEIEEVFGVAIPDDLITADIFDTVESLWAVLSTLMREAGPSTMEPCDRDGTPVASPRATGPAATQ
jgi:acyl carrier protein